MICFDFFSCSLGLVYCSDWGVGTISDVVSDDTMVAL